MQYSRNIGAGNSFLDGRTQKEISRSWTGWYNLPNRSLRWNSSEIWPRYKIGFVEQSFNYWIPTDGTGGLQGCTDKLNKDLGNVDQNDNGEYGFELDPAGGHGEFKLFSRESTLWHRTPLKIRLEAETNYLDDTTLKISTVNCPYKINTDEVKIDTLSKTTNGTKTTIEYKITPNGVTTRKDKDQTLNESDQYDMLFSFTIGPNNNPSNSRGTITIVGFYDSIGNLISFNDNDKIILFKWWQKPNLLYYVDMAFVEKPLSASSKPKIATSQYYKNTYDNTNFSLYLFVEFGISLDGGQTINWNQDWEKFLSSKGITSIDTDKISTNVPADLPASSFTFEISGTNKERFVIPSGKVSLYFNKSDYTGIYGKYFVVSLNSTSRNTEYNNDASHIHQSYYVDPSELVNLADTTSNYKAIAGWQANSKSTIGFLLRRISTTDPWVCKVKASLSYIKDQMKYKGSTDPSERNNGSN